ncbi:MAG: hypothetical protein AAB150_10130 [Pseudomonadota bacterium]
MNYSLMVVASDYSMAEEKILVRRLLERGVDGLFPIGQQRYPGTLALLEESRRPFVESYISDDFGRDGYLGFFNVKDAASVVDYLVALGNRRIAMFAGITDGNDRAYRRLAGVRARPGELGIPFSNISRLSCRMTWAPRVRRSAICVKRQACRRR